MVQWPGGRHDAVANELVVVRERPDPRALRRSVDERQARHPEVRELDHRERDDEKDRKDERELDKGLTVVPHRPRSARSAAGRVSSRG